MFPNQTTNPAVPGAVPGNFRVPNLLDPENVETYGLADKFVATMAGIRAVPYDFMRLASKQKGKTPGGNDGYRLCAALYFDPDPGQGLDKLDPSYYGTGMPLQYFVPSPDAVNPAGPPQGDPDYATPEQLWAGYAALAKGEIHILHPGSTPERPIPYDHTDIFKYAGLFAAPVGGYNADGTTKHGHKGMDPKSDWMLFLNSVEQCAKTAGTPLDMKALAAAYSTRGFAAFEGHRGRFDRLPRPGGSDPSKKILLMTEYLGFKGANVGTSVIQAQAAQPAAQIAQTVQATVQQPGAVAGADPNAASNAARVMSSVDPIDVYVRNALAAVGGKAVATSLISGVAVQGSPFFGNPPLIKAAFDKIMAPQGALLIAAGFNFNQQTSEVSLPGIV